MSENHEQTLVKGVLEGDPRCEQALYLRYRQTMFRLCLRYAGDRHEAEDMLQEGFLKVFEDLPKYRGAGSLEGWMKKVIVHTALGILKKRKKLVFEELAPEYNLPDLPEIPEAPLDRQCLIGYIQQLPTGYRTVLNLHILEGYSHEEIGSMLGIGASTSRSQLAKARNLLKKRIGDSTTVMYEKR